MKLETVIILLRRLESRFVRAKNYHYSCAINQLRPAERLMCYRCWISCQGFTGNLVISERVWYQERNWIPRKLQRLH